MGKKGTGERREKVRKVWSFFGLAWKKDKRSEKVKRLVLFRVGHKGIGERKEVNC